MIISIESDLPSFKSVRLRPGLNVLLADKSPSSDEKQTRNSAGKSSLVDVINFLLGSRASSAVASHDALKAYTFYGTFELDGNQIKVGRSGNAPSKILVDEEKATAFGLRRVVS